MIAAGIVADAIVVPEPAIGPFWIASDAGPSMSASSSSRDCDSGWMCATPSADVEAVDLRLRRGLGLDDRSRRRRGIGRVGIRGGERRGEEERDDDEAVHGIAPLTGGEISCSFIWPFGTTRSTAPLPSERSRC